MEYPGWRVHYQSWFDFSPATGWDAEAQLDDSIRRPTSIGGEPTSATPTDDQLDVGNLDEYPLEICYIAIDNGHLEWLFPWKMVIFHTYVSLPERKPSGFWDLFGPHQPQTLVDAFFLGSWQANQLTHFMP